MADPPDEGTHPEPAPPYDASDPEQVNRRKREKGRRDKAKREVMRELLSKPAGRAWLWDVLSAGRMFQTSFVQGDPCATAFNEGQRNMALRLTAEAVTVAPDSYLLMMRENGKDG